jgi:CheY-like chemotaxis protein
VRILSLDWDSAFQRDLALELEAAGHQVELLSRAQDALSSDAARPFDLIVCETRLPDKNGLQFVRELKAVRSEPPAIVFLTEVEDGEIRELCRAEGARRFLLKKDGWPTIVAEIHGVIAEIDPLSEGITLLEGPRPEARIFKGNLETIEILDIIQLLNLGRKTGILMLSGSILDGRIAFEEGEIVHAQNHDESGVAALGSLLALERGSFRFEAGTSSSERTIHQSTSTLLLDALRLQDEGARRTHGGAPGSEQEESAFDFEHHDPEPPPAGDWLYAGLGGGTEPPSVSPRVEEPVPADYAGGGALGHSPFASVPMWPAEPELPEALRPAPAAPEAHFPAEAPAHHEITPAPITQTPFGAGEMEEPPASSAHSGPAPWTAEEPFVAPRLEPGKRAARFKAGPGMRGRLKGVRRSVALSVCAVAALLASGYVAFFSDLLHGPAEAMENADYRSLMLEAAANQAKIDSLEQVVGGLTQSVQSGTVTPADAQQRISAIQTEIQRATTNLDVARKAADAKLDEEQRKDAKKKSETAAAPESTPAPVLPGGAAAQPGLALDSGAGGPPADETAAASLASAPRADSGVGRRNPVDLDSVRPEPEPMEIADVAVAPRLALEDPPAADADPAAGAAADPPPPPPP